MSIMVRCAGCGGEFRAKQELAGRRAKCPKCGNVLQVPRPKEEAEGDVVYGLEVPATAEIVADGPVAAGQPAGAACPSCGSPRAENAVICIQCGVDFRTGKQLTTTVAPKTFGPFSISRGAGGAMTLTVAAPGVLRKRRQSFDLTGYDTVYYDTLDPTAGSAAADAAAGLAVKAAIVLGGLALGWIVIPRGGGDDPQFVFEVGLSGPDQPPIQLGRSQESSEVRELATWLAQATNFPLKRHDRRTD